MVNFTPAFDGSFFTVALIWTTLAAPACTVPALEETATVIANTVMVVKADWELSATLVALILTGRSAAGGVLGAV